MSEGPFCVDCEHCRKFTASGLRSASSDSYWCARLGAKHNIVTGERGYCPLDCAEQRAGLGVNPCGPEGKYFTPRKPTGWRRLRLWLAASLGLLVLAGCSDESRQLIAVTDTPTGCQYVIAVADPGYNNAMVHPIKGTCKNEGK